MIFHGLRRYQLPKLECNYITVGPMVWYQMFEYAIGHWLQKATEHVIGCVLCSPGCFSLFRGVALMDDAVMKKYTTLSSEAIHYVQYDQGEKTGHFPSPLL
jgi:chitin synthase